MTVSLPEEDARLAMAAFLIDQLDFIFFFYGLAFLLLGATCWAIARRRRNERSWAMLAAFGLIHGAGEWLDLSALILGDSPVFSSIRLSVMTASFVFLAEFGRIQMSDRRWTPGRWIYPLILGLVVLIAYAAGLTEAGIAARYALGLVGALASSLALLGRARSLSGPGRSYARSAAIAFALYGIAAGFIVPAAPFWPASIVNDAAFAGLTGVPIQLIRGLLACWIALAVWAIWGEQLASEVSSGSFSAYLREQFLWTAGLMSLILMLGWALTERLGEIYRHNVETEASGDIDLVASRVSKELDTADALTETLAGSPSTKDALAQGGDAALARAKAVLDLHVGAGRAEGGYLLDAEGGAVAASGALAQRRAADLLGSVRERSGSPERRAGFVFDAATRATVYHTSRDVTDAENRVVGAAALIVSVEAFAKDLEGLNRPYYFVDPHGVVVLSNLPDADHRTLWPLDTAAVSELAGRFDGVDVRPIARAEIRDAAWMQIDGAREYVRRRFIAGTDWSLIILKPTRQIFATRFVGIVITLLVTIVALMYLLGKERWMHEDAQRKAQSKLQDLARDLNIKATTDPLTGLYNRLRLNDILPHEMARSDRVGSPLSVVMYDIDQFKGVNDRFGHAVGDKVLATLSGTVSASLRATDNLVRWGGEEFLLILPDTDPESARHVAEKLRAAVAAQPFDEVGQVTSSFGVAGYAAGEPMADLIARADKALYRAKANGRNQVAVAPPPLSRRTAQA
ncbi:diguanylate cyclase [Hansschlegelia zhihuaiae]|uniref:diguanylate cyclase n=1 Tax=Hansschlegelia zhihuaiae TaxID=405005 RepID=A0A4V1KJW0_9HYPH|nr:diguanylate cyclase [Hansschlegelia zhihuaiae]RXF75562.1 diguanylate cyclase [Hansschlegelia zhihuaiae]